MTPERAHAEAERELLRAEAERDKAYRERAALVAYLAACYPSEIVLAEDAPGWWIVFVTTPSGQMSWHVSGDDLELFAHLPAATGVTWDGHTTDEKYERLAEMTDRIARAGGFAGVVAATATARPAPLADGSLKDLKSVTAERDEFRKLLDEIGVIAANAPEDGDSFGLLEEIAMRIGAAGVPDSTPIEEWPDPENPVTGRTPGAAAPGELAKTIRALDLARDEITALRNRCGRLLGEFGRGSDGYRARLSSTVLAREYRDAGLPVPDRLSHLESK